MFCPTFCAVIALVAICSATSAPANSETKLTTGILKGFKTVHPQVLQKTRHTRNVHPDSMNIRIVTDLGEIFTLQLTLNEKLVAPQFTSVYYSENGDQVEITDQVNCFYHGEVLEHPEWMVAMDSCQGLRGSFGDWSNKTGHYNIEPLSHYDKSLEQPHALYLEADSEEEGTCGTTHENYWEYSENPLNIDEGELERGRRQSPTGAYIIELCIVNDRSQYRFYQRDVSRTVSRAISIINVADRMYAPVNVRIVLVHVITWTSSDQSQFSTSPDITLQNFRTYTMSLQNEVSFDAIMLLTGNDFDGNTVGIAYLNTMCGLASVGVVQDRHTSTSATGSTLAHEVGHLLNMQHDTSSCSCNDPSRRCLMAAVSSSQTPHMWSSCSITYLQDSLTREHNNLGRCLANEPETTVGIPVCGNGIREGNEICDCGSEQECNDPCCNARTCQMADGAQCTRGECCSNTCQFVSAGTTCRSSDGQCDIAEHCTGQSSECPTDVHAQDGSSCNNNQAYCFSGECRTYNAQCQEHFGTNKGVDECFINKNMDGNYFGNCGTDGTNFISCSANNVMCGQLFCQEGEYQNTVNSVYVLEVGVYVPSRRRVELCVAFTPPPTSDIVSPGLVKDGIKCGSGRMCYEQRCVPVSSLGFPQCPTGSNGRVCSGNGKCNNKGECSCFAGFSGSTCHPSAPTVNECLIDNGGCAHECVDAPNAYQCQCRSGYRLSSDERSCNDINECLEGRDSCQQRCTNTQGSYTCTCNSGYMLSSDGHSCDSSQMCGGRFTATSGSFQTPGWPYNYPQQNFQCEWIIDISVTGYVIQFVIDTSAYGINGRHPCTKDYIQFFNGLQQSATSLYKLCKFDNPGPIRTSTSTARVVFAGSVNSNRPSSRVGVRVSYNIVDIDECSLGTHDCQQHCLNTAGSYMCSCSNDYSLSSDGRTCIVNPAAVHPPPSNGLCGDLLTATSGSFSTPFWPERYPQQDFQCEWIINVPTGRRILFAIDQTAFGINGRPPCTDDYVEFFNGNTNNAASLEKICGLRSMYTSFPSFIYTSSSRARVVFAGSRNSKRPSSRVGARVAYRAI